MGRKFKGSHFVVAHLSPDIDTTVASFISWMEAFACKVGEGQHIWNLPGGPPDSPITAQFEEFYGKHLFELTARMETHLNLTAIDLMTEKGVVKSLGNTSISTIDHDYSQKAILLVDEGHFLGDWRSDDVEVIRQIVILFKAVLKWFENNFLIELINFFAQDELAPKDITPFFDRVFSRPIESLEPFLDYSEKQKNELNLLLQRVLNLPDGNKSHFRTLFDALKEEVPELLTFLKSVEEGIEPGILKESRSKTFFDHRKANLSIK